MLLFADSRNFHARNFPTLFRMVKAGLLETTTHQDDSDELKLAFGDYAKLQTRLAAHLTQARRIPVHRMREHRHRGVPVFPVFKYELLRRLSVLPAWFSTSTENSDEVILEKAQETAGTTLYDNLAATLFWIDRWSDALKAMPKTPEAVATFGNSLIYTRALSGMYPSSGVLPISFEHFFTGVDHYMEPWGGPIQGFSPLRIGAPEGLAADPTLVAQRLRLMKNKNVRQPAFQRRAVPARTAKRVLLLAQVVNDFAALSPTNPTLGTIAAYKAAIDATLAETDLDIVIKPHPYEARATGALGAITQHELSAWLARKPEASRRRVTFAQRESLQVLCHETDAVLTLHSQGALEAFAAGLRVVTFGDAFYSRQGFTHDCTSAAELPQRLLRAVSSPPDDEQVHQYMRFMTFCFQRLVSAHESTASMEARFALLGISSEPAAAAPVPKKAPPAQVAPAVAAPPKRQQPQQQPDGSPLARKVRKLARSPRQFIRDALKNLQKKEEVER
jgi:hypothetical protein